MSLSLQQADATAADVSRLKARVRYFLTYVNAANTTTGAPGTGGSGGK